ncbi:hypothetical protein [Pseudoclavibacter sp. 8L]|uniref:hypothetical protein n=1 Tax=Pseudoclavibacter sp. 8L TaxID=2653162 RepID=UPI00135ACC22|nr:hypothetical protein [Pseudoclavibacter sp. 8L]
MQFKGWQNATEIQRWVRSAFVPRGYDHHLRTDRERDGGYIEEHAPNFLVLFAAEGPGEVRVDQGDWIVRDASGQVSSYSSEGFEAAFIPRRVS